MLNNIFLFKGKRLEKLEDLNIYNYPDNVIKIEDKDLISKIIFGHDHAELLKQFKRYQREGIAYPKGNLKKQTYQIDTPVPQLINDLNIYTSCINGEIIIGLIFDQEDNPYDYKDIFLESLHEMLTNGEGYSFEDDQDIENLLIGLFIDIRRHGDEQIEKIPEVVLPFEDSFIKIFLFGIDEVGKTSLCRRIKTGKFNDNYFVPTKKFNIEYLQEEEDLLAFWDMPGQRSFRKKWVMGLQDSNIIIYMIDVSNQVRFEEAKKELWKILTRFEAAKMPMIILGNKVDLLNPSNNFKEQLPRIKNEIYSNFNLDDIDDRDWELLLTSVKTNFNIDKIVNLIKHLVKT